LPRPKPSRFPDTGPAIFVPSPLTEEIGEVLEEQKDIEKTEEEEISEETEQPQEAEQSEKEQDEISEQEKSEEQNGTIVKGPRTGGSGGISWKEVQKVNQPSETEEESEKEEDQKEQEQPEATPHIVINEVQIKDNEFVELYNPTDTAINLASYSFCYYSSAKDWNEPHRNKTFPATASISANGYYLIGILNFPESGGNPDADWQIKTDQGNLYVSGQLSNSAGSIAIFPWDPSEKTASESQAGAIDTVAWGDVEYVMEGVPFQGTIDIDESIQRKDNGQDTDDNNTDFELQKIPSPTNSNGEQRIPGTTIPDDRVISEHTTWTIAGSPYYIQSNANQWPIVEIGKTLTIEPGVVVMPLNPDYTFLEIKGTLEAKGTDSDKIVFTSKNDTEYGGTGSASAGDWKNMIFTDTSRNSELKNVIFRYGGRRTDSYKTYTEMIKVDNSSIEMENVVMEKSESRGLFLINSNSKIKKSSFKDSKIGVLIEGSSDTSTIENCSFENNTELGLEIRDGAWPKIENNQFTGNGEVADASDQGAIMFHSAYPEFKKNQASGNNINGILVHQNSSFSINTKWKKDLPYVLNSSSGHYPTVASGSTLILEPGVVIKPMSEFYTALLVEGTLIAKAASDSEIVITSLKDDSWGGDTNGDGNNQNFCQQNPSDAKCPQPGDWKNIRFVSGSSGMLDHVFIYYGSSEPIIVEDEESVELKAIEYEP